ncbi:flagellar brake protein [Colwellia sp. D2M02]|uniref:Flagellar brake protein n=1 Tax=Colwellia asteriadis TaxID=517723 RepID=A0ABN1L2N6_9GAMM|nr:PilZ domain-containing protein [Colwellia sp. D2M02]MBU2893055.1 flagellar brake protein [Colwellia sp. D2M02]
MAEAATQIDTAKRLSQNLALLHAGSTVTIDITTPAGQKGKFRTTFIGYLPKQYILIQFPELTKLGRFSQYLNQGAGITVRGLIEGHEGVVVAFVSTIKQTLQMPSRIMVLDFPRSVMVQNLRSSVRIDTQITAKVKIDQAYWQTTILNLSVAGGQLSIVNGDKLMLTENKAIEIIIEGEDGVSNIKLQAIICNVKQQVEGLSFGVKFAEESASQVSDLLLQVITVES